MKKTSIILSSLLVASSAWAQLSTMSLSDAEQLVSQPTPAVKSVLDSAPLVYDFKNSRGESSVDYSGQVFRQVLINDMKSVAGSIRRGEYEGKEKVAYDTLNSFYQYSADAVKASSKAVNGVTPILTTAKDLSGQNAPTIEFFYLDISEGSKHLKEKIAGIDNPLRNKFVGWETKTLAGVDFDKDQDGNMTPDELMQGYMSIIAKNASSSTKSFKVPDGQGGEQTVQAAAITEEGLDISQLAQKLLHGSLSFSQAAEDYMNTYMDPAKKKGLFADNTDSDASYTGLQHAWDEAYGYFGAARNYLELSDVEIRSDYSGDSFDMDDYVGLGMGDGEISLQSEKNLGMSVNAAKRDLAAKGQDTDFTQKTMEAFVKGRHLTQERPEGYLPYVQAYSIIALNQWEQVLAATVIHYINETAANLQAYGTDSYNFTTLAKVFSEMKGFAFSFQFNPNSVLSSEQFAQLHKLLGDTPVLPQSGDVNAYVNQLMEARDLLQNAYGFSDETVKGW